ncbi:hypothetical protein CHS0354_014146 [Potamilus streckersoni]|uniref:Cadherin domain-containing protein n=1 Tax=Potamilus streckersoni TaxID=2493646 RepID=A0AAE0TKT2_9BIVA|nr:hypothetical protein CHS0354_014146 [Potamilus streckersoni]
MSMIEMKKGNFTLFGTMFLLIVLKGASGSGCTGSGLETMGYPFGGSPTSVGKTLDGLLAGSGYIAKSEMTSYTAPCCGYVREIDYFHENPGGNTKAQVWRLTSGTSYQLVGEIEIGGAGAQYYTVPSADRIRVQTGDVVGWYSASANVMSYKGDPAFDATIQQVFATAPSVNSIVNWGTATALSDRYYAIQYILDLNAVPVFTNLPTTKTTTNGDAVSTLLHTISVSDSDVADQGNLTITRTDMISYFSFDSVAHEVRIATTLSGAVGNHYLVFKVTDFCENTATSTLTITVTNVAPTIHNLPNSTSLSENTYVSTLLYKLSVTDPTDTVSCSLATTGTPFSVRQISGSTDYGIYSQTNPGFSYDTINSYTLSVDCTDGYASTTGTYTVYMLRNQAPVITNLPASTMVSTASTTGTVAYTVTATDAENDQLYFNMTCSPSPCPFTILNSGVIQVTESLQNHQTVGYDLSVSVYDGRSLVGPKTLTIDITDINGAVNINNLPLGSALTVPENTAIGNSVFQISITDSNVGDTHTYTMTSSPGSGLSFFGINSSSGLISTTGSVLNYEALSTRTFDLSVTVSDGTSTNTKILQIQVTNVNEAPSFSQTVYAISTNEAPSGTVLPDAGISVTDPDSGDTKAFSNDCGANTGLFTMSASTGRLTFASNYDYDLGTLPTTVTCIVTVTDSGGLTATSTLSININNINDNTPIFSPSSYTFFAGYYAAVQSVIGSVTASDGDLGTYGVSTYSLDQSSPYAAYFGIKSDTGDVYISSSVQPIGDGNSVTINAIATDSGGLSSTALITIKISQSTTSTTTTTTDRYRTFFEDGRNVAWFAVLCLSVAATAVVTLWIFCRMNKEGCPKIKICKRRRKIIRIKKVKRFLKPEIKREMPPIPRAAPKLLLPPPPPPPPRPLEPYKGFDFWKDEDFKKDVLN